MSHPVFDPSLFDEADWMGEVRRREQATYRTIPVPRFAVNTEKGILPKLTPSAIEAIKLDAATGPNGYQCVPCAPGQIHHIVREPQMRWDECRNCKKRWPTGFKEFA